MSEKSDPGYTPDRFGHIWVHTGAPDDDMAWCKHCSVGIDQPAARARCGEPWVINHGEQVSESQDDGTELLDDNDYPGEDEPRLTGHPPDPNGPDGEIDLTCKCGPDHDDCAVDCQCSCHDAINITLPDGRTLIFASVHDAVLAAHAILSEVEILTRGDI